MSSDDLTIFTVIAAYVSKHYCTSAVLKTTYVAVPVQIIMLPKELLAKQILCENIITKYRQNTRIFDHSFLHQ